MEATKTQGFICHDREYKTVWYIGPDGSLNRANEGNVLDSRSGYAIGRWEGPAWQVVDRVMQLRKFAGEAMRSEIDAYLSANHANKTLQAAFA